MPNSTVLNLTEPEQYEKTVLNAQMKEWVTARGTYGTRLTRINLNRVTMQRASKALPSLSHTAVSKNQVGVVFLVDADQQPMLNSGIVVHPGETVSYAPGTEHHLRTEAGYHAAAMGLSLEDFAACGQALMGREPKPPTTTRVIRQSSSSMSRLINLHNAACDVAKNAPDILAHPDVAKAMEQELIRALITCMAGEEPSGPVRDRQASVMRRFEQALEAHEGDPLYVTELCAEIGVSDRNLRLHCQERLGMSPHQFLWLRRMNMVRRALAHADFAQSTVTAIAVEHGFGELGRFSVQYRKLFGESPSVTLRHIPDEPRTLAMSPAEGLRFPIFP